VASGVSPARAPGGPAVAEVCDAEFSNLDVLTLDGSKPSRLIQAHFGTPDPPHGAGVQHDAQLAP
jgi:hypothetical protein